MNTIQIDEFAKNNPVTKTIYGGCFAADELPQQKIPSNKLPIGIVVNLCVSNRSDDSCHWVFIHVDKESVEYFDSGGSDSYKINSHVKKFVLRQKKKVVSSNVQIQSYVSDYCGMFVLTRLYAKALNINLNKYLSAFKRTNLERNDPIVTKLFRCAFVDRMTNCIR